MMYKVFGLTEAQVHPTWTSFCAECFKDKKPTPPTAEYFARHYFNDPTRDASLIRVCKLSSGSGGDGVEATTVSSTTVDCEIVSCLRIFSRSISTANESQTPLKGGGIGEVCTSHSHRKRGLAKLLLNDAIQIMGTSNSKEGGDLRLGMECSLLHASPALTPFYKIKTDYQSVVTPWEVLTISPHKIMTLEEEQQQEKSIQIRLAVFPKDTKTLQRIHKEYSEDRFFGCIIRTEEYWNEYIAKEIGDSLFLLTVSPPNDIIAPSSSSANDKDIQNDVIIGWISIRPRSPVRYQLRDFGIDHTSAKLYGLTTSHVVSYLLKVAIEQQQQSEQKEHLNKVELHVPSAVCAELREESKESTTRWIDWDAIVSDDDNGWMYKVFPQTQEHNGAVDKSRNILYLMKQNKDKHHLIWPSDSF